MAVQVRTRQRVQSVKAIIVHTCCFRGLSDRCSCINLRAVWVGGVIVQQQ